MESFARALRQLPATIADNAGLDSAGGCMLWALDSSGVGGGGHQLLAWHLCVLLSLQRASCVASRVVS